MKPSPGGAQELAERQMSNNHKEDEDKKQEIQSATSDSHHRTD